MSLAYLFEGRYDEALTASNESLRLNKDGLTGKLIQIAAHAAQGSPKCPQQARDAIMTSHPKFSLGDFEVRQPYRHPVDLKRFTGWLRQAGLG